MHTDSHGIDSWMFAVTKQTEIDTKTDINRHKNRQEEPSGCDSHGAGLVEAVEEECQAVRLAAVRRQVI